MKRLYTPSDESELVFLRSLFEAEGIPFYVLNDNFGSLYSGVYLNYFNAKSIMVPEVFFEDARDLILSVKKDAVFDDERDKGDGRGNGESEILRSLLDFFSFRWLYSRRGKGGR